MGFLGQVQRCEVKCVEKAHFGISVLGLLFIKIMVLIWFKPINIEYNIYER